MILNSQSEKKIINFIFCPHNVERLQLSRTTHVFFFSFLRWFYFAYSVSSKYMISLALWTFGRKKIIINT